MNEICPICKQSHTTTACNPKEDPRQYYAHWSTAQLALKAVTKERDALLLQVDGLRKALEQIATAKSLPSPITGDSYRLDNILQSIARKALEGCAQKPVDAICWCASGGECPIHKRVQEPLKKCDHGEILVIHKCADCGEVIEFV